MNRLEKISNELQELTSDTQVLGYWDRRQTFILDHIRAEKIDTEIAVEVLHRLTQSLNNKEKYSSVYHLYLQGFLPIQEYISPSTMLSELKFELARGLHHNRKYSQAKLLFNELATHGFETSRYEEWWDQSAFSSIREKVWVKTDLLPSLVRLVLLGGYVFVTIKTEMFLTCTYIFIVLFEIYESWWYYFKVKAYLREHSLNLGVGRLKGKIRRIILIELGISLLIFPLYFFQNNWITGLVGIMVLYFLSFQFGLNYYYLPKLIGKLNREKSESLKKL